MVDVGTPIQNPAGAKMASKIDQWIQKCEKRIPEFRHVGGTLFSRNHNNYCAVGPKSVLEGYFLMEIGLFSVFVVFLCAMFYTTVLSLRS